MGTFTDLDDAALVRRALAGESPAYGELVMRHQDRLRTVFSFYVASRESIEEHVQEAFVEAYASLASYDPSVPFIYWLKGLALNVMRMEARRLATAKRHGPSYLQWVLLSKGTRASADAPYDATRSALRTRLERLGQRDQDLLRAKYEERASVRALARERSLTESNLKVRLFRIRDALRKCIRRRLAVGR